MSKTQISIVLRYLNISIALYRCKTLKLKTEHKRQVGRYQLAKCKKNVHLQIWVNDLPSIFEIRAAKLIQASESRNRDGQHLNDNLKMPKTKKHPEKQWFSKLTSEEIILGLPTRFNN